MIISGKVNDKRIKAVLIRGEIIINCETFVKLLDNR